MVRRREARGRRSFVGDLVDAFRGLDVRVDPWDVDYGTELPLDVANEQATDEVVLDLEMPFASWAPLSAVAGAVPPLIFIDGVRRMDIRLLVRGDARLAHGALASFAVGAVRLEGVEARKVAERVDRLAIVGGGLSFPTLVDAGRSLSFRPISTAATDPEGPIEALQKEMRACEQRLAREMSAELGALVVADGPLRFEASEGGRGVGYIKTLSKLYLPPSSLSFLASLPPGARSPLFAIRSPGGFARYAWFLRLAAVQMGISDLSGIVRLEVAEVVGLDEARRLADTTARALPRLAPSRARDPRSPQNLLPIGGLESSLRRRLGDGRVVRRRLESLIAKEAGRG